MWRPRSRPRPRLRPAPDFARRRDHAKPHRRERARPSRSGTDAATWGRVAAALRANLCGAGRARVCGENRASPAAEFALADGDDEDGEGRIAGFAWQSRHDRRVRLDRPGSPRRIALVRPIDPRRSSGASRLRSYNFGRERTAHDHECDKAYCFYSP